MHRPWAMDWDLDNFNFGGILGCDVKSKARKPDRALLRLISAAKRTADCALVKGEFQESCLHYTSAINAGFGRLSPSKLSVLYSNRSAAWIGQGQYARACGDAEAALALRPNWAQVRQI